MQYHIIMIYYFFFYLFLIQFYCILYSTLVIGIFKRVELCCFRIKMVPWQETHRTDVSLQYTRPICSSYVWKSGNFDKVPRQRNTKEIRSRRYLSLHDQCYSRYYMRYIIFFMYIISQIIHPILCYSVYIYI